jgi:beta-lactamase regulating signal transducer with metallopeptidase domain
MTAVLEHSAQGLNFLLDAAEKATVLLVAAGLLSLVLRRQSAAMRHLVWLVALAGIVLMPVLTLMLPGLNVPFGALLPSQVATAGKADVFTVRPTQAAGPRAPQPRAPAPAARAVAAAPSPAPAAPAAVLQKPLPAAEAPVVTPPAAVIDRAEPLPWSAWVLIAWLAGAAAVAAYLAVGTVSVWAIVRRARRVEGGPWGELMESLCREFGLARPVRLAVSEQAVIPVAWGFVRPVILIPRAAEGWPEDRRRIVLLHELAHVKRWDCLAQTLALAACVLYWFNPLAWLAARRLRIEREGACDDLVLAAGSPPADYAGHLLEIVRALHPAARTPLAAVAMARRSQFEGRMLAILDPRRNRRALTRWGVLAAALLVAGIVVPLACLKATGGNAAELEGTKQGPTLTKEQILLGVEAARSQIKDISVNFSYNQVKGPPGNLGRRLHVTWVLKESKAYTARVFGADPAPDSKTFKKEIAYNGRRTTFYEPDRGLAMVRTELTRETKTQGEGFFDLMLLNPPRDDGDGRNDQSLVSLLKSGKSRLRKQTEVVRGRICHVADLMDASSDRPSMTVWIDAQRGFLPMRQVFYTKPGGDEILMLFDIEEARDLGNGLWFPVYGRKLVNPVPGMPEISAGIECVMEVDGWREGKPALTVNQGVKDEFFDLWKRLPPGTMLKDMDAGDTVSKVGVAPGPLPASGNAAAPKAAADTPAGNPPVVKTVAPEKSEARPGSPAATPSERVPGRMPAEGALLGMRGFGGAPPAAPADILTARFEATVYEVQVPADLAGKLDSAALSAKAADPDALRAALAEFGPTKVLYRVDQPVNVFSENITIESREPMVVNTRKTDTGQSTRTVQYMQLGLTISIAAGPPPKESDRKGFDVRMRIEVASLGEGSVELTPQVKSPVFRNVSISHSATLQYGRPFVILNVTYPTKDEKASATAFVMRTVFSEIKP